MRLLLYLALFASMSWGCGEKSSASDATPVISQSATATSGTIITDDPPAEAHIEVTVVGQPDGVVQMIGMLTDQKFRVDTASIRDGKFSFHKPNQGYIQGLYYFLFSDQSFVQALLSEDQTFSMQTQAGDIIGSMQVEGSIDNELLYQALVYEENNRSELNRITNELSQAQEGTPQYTDLIARRNQINQDQNTFVEGLFEKHPNTFFTSFKRAGKNPELRDFKLADGSPDNQKQVYYFKREFWDGVDFNDERLLRTPVITNKLTRYMKNMTVQTPDSIIASAKYLVDQVLDKPEYLQYFANWVTLQYEPGKVSLMDAEAVHVFMIQNYFTYDRAFWSDSVNIYALQRRAGEMQSSLVGKKGPNVTTNGPDGKPYSIDDIKSDYVVVYLFNPDCEHCQEETPKLAEYYRQKTRQELEVFAIGVDTQDDIWRKYIAEKALPWINVYDPTNRSIYAKYYVDVTPEIYVLNKDRTIIAKNIKVNQIEEVIRRDRQG